ncbi:MAG: hypothetical protein IKU72_03370 [Oscillospiraceae bacterium]|nr:hypothetical protein [Oscillospiraceae bacterium]
MTFRIGGVELRLHWSFWLLLGGVAAAPLHRLVVLGLASAVCHELGHLAAMAAAGCRPRCLHLSLMGAKLSGRGLPNLKRELFAIASGPAVNLLLALLFGLSAQYAPRLFSAMNLVLGGFNLLPVQGMDGGRMLWLLAEHRWGYRRAKRICIAVAVVVLVLLLWWSVCLWKKHPRLPSLLLFPLVPAAAFFRWLKD